jgi:hypothetical protein
MILVVALALLCIRLFPWLMRVLSWLADAWRGAALVLALRYLARSARQYVGPMLLLVLTLSLAVFTASMARTLDDYTLDSVYYDVGADYRLIEMGESTELGPSSSLTSEAGSDAQTEDQTGPEWLFLPVSEHTNIPGVTQAARIWTKQVDVLIGGENHQGVLVGIDRLDLPKVAFFRRDFAPASLGALMNMDARLARQVRALDDEVDEINREMYLKIGQAVRKNPHHIERLLSYLSASRHLERIADYATNIAEDVIYLIEGQIVRHKPTFPT